MDPADPRTQGLEQRKPGEGRPRLIVIEGGPPQSIELTADAYAIGRQQDNDIVLRSERVSRRHARVARAGDEWLVEDLGSFNGTLVNGARVPQETPRALRHKDLLQLCEYRLLFLAHVDAQGERLLSTIFVDRSLVKEEADRAVREFLGG
jgi:pSer/pThr/pTyr-binding forkhead associated (FHA) protein